ncbi:MAG: hypothetical protein ACI4IL_02290 [Eubacterium sp.]
MDFYKRYSKEIMEPFALKVLRFSFDSKYREYHAPTNSDNFDYVSTDGNNALEITSVITKNEMEEYIYEKLKASGKQNLKSSHIKDLKLTVDGDIQSYYGGSMSEVISLIRKALENKQKKALRKLEIKSYKSVDLCMCINDGSLFDKHSFEIAFNDLDKYLFNNIFFITSAHFIRYNKKIGFEEYPRIISENS